MTDDDNMIPDEDDLRILAALQEGFPLEPRPFLRLSEDLGISEEEVLERVKGLEAKGLLRRIGPILDLGALGIKGVLAALKVSEDEAALISMVVNRFPEVSHNYLRPHPSGYNMWFTISAIPQRIDEILTAIEEETRKPLMVLPTRKIFKIGVKFDIL